MHLSATSLAFALLVCLQTVAAAPVIDAAQRDVLEKREAGPEKSGPSTIFAYDDYVPPVEKRSAPTSPETVKRQVAPQALQAKPDVFEYHQYGAPPPKTDKRDGPIHGFGKYIKPACDEGGTCYITYGGKNGPAPTFQPEETIEPEEGDEPEDK